jgi:mono/diheme cytochrome c family protein
MVVAGMLTGCGGAASSAAGAESSGGEPALVISDPSEWQALAAAGKDTFDVACGACHPGGDADLGPGLKRRRTPVAVMTKQIREGSGRMKPIGEDKLPESEMRGLMVYLATLDAVGDVQGP